MTNTYSRQLEGEVLLDIYVADNKVTLEFKIFEDVHFEMIFYKVYDSYHEAFLAINKYLKNKNVLPSGFEGVNMDETRVKLITAFYFKKVKLPDNGLGYSFKGDLEYAYNSIKK